MTDASLSNLKKSTHKTQKLGWLKAKDSPKKITQVLGTAVLRSQLLQFCQ